MGYRFSSIVPRGKDTGSARFDAQYVRIEPAMYYKKPPVLSEALPIKTQPLARFKAGREEHLIIPAAGVMVVMLALVGVFVIRPDLRASLARDRDLKLTKLTAVFTLIAAVSIGATMLFRLFLTGVDDGLIARASTIGNSGHVFHYTQQTLSMSYASLMMLYTGVGLATLLVLVWIGLRVLPVDHERIVTREDTPQNMLVSRLIKPLRFAGYALLIGVNLMLVLAPWTNTMWGLILR